MPWTGLDEEELRGLKLEFTAINTTALPITTPTPTSGDFEIFNDQHTRTIASEYLGRDDDPLPVVVSGKANEKTRKLPWSTDGAPQKKRQLTRDVRDKVSNRATNKLAETVTPPQSSKATKPKNKTSSKKRTLQQASVGTHEDEQSLISPSKSVSVYGSSTSMDTLDTTSPRTSCDSIEANPGHSFTLYQSSTPSVSHPTNVLFQHHWPIPAAEVGDTASDRDAAELASDMYSNLHDYSTPLDRGTYVVSTTRKVAVRAKGQQQVASDQIVGTPGHTNNSDLEIPKTMFEPKRSTNFSKTASAIAAGRPFEHKESKDEHLELISAAELLENEAFSDEVEDEGLADVAKLLEDQIGRSITRSRSKNVREVDADEDYGGALLTCEERTLLATPKRSGDAPKPIVRNPFQQPVLDRSPLFGVSKNTVLRTCFRIGEALNCGSQAARVGANIVLELYARVVTSWREQQPGRKQYFIFKDLYHDKPPHLEGAFELWGQAELWDLDSKPFLAAGGQGVMCRLVARMRRDSQKWRLEVLSIWEATWEDINYVAGIYCE